MLKNAARKGFTLIELLIVVVIIGILAAIAIPKFSNTKDKAKLASVTTDVRNLMNTMEVKAGENQNKYIEPVLNTDFNVSTGNVAAFDVADDGYKITVTNSSIVQAVNSFSVRVGSKRAGGGVGGKMTCP